MRVSCLRSPLSWIARLTATIVGLGLMVTASPVVDAPIGHDQRTYRDQDDGMVIASARSARRSPDERPVYPAQCAAGQVYCVPA